MAKAKKTKKRADHYEDKLQINGSFEDVIKVSVSKPEKKEEEPVQKGEKKEEEKPVQKKKK